MDLKNFYLNTPLDWPEYIRIKLADIPQEFINEYKLNKISRTPGSTLKCAVACTVSPKQASLPTNSSETTLPNSNTTRQPPPPSSGTTNGTLSCLHSLLTTLPSNTLVMPTWIIFYQALKKHYKVSEEINGTRFAGMTLKWNYSPIHAERFCRLSMPGYILNVCTRYKHLMPTKRQLSPHKHREIIFGQTTQLTHVDPYNPPLSTEGVKRIQGIIGALLYYACAVNNKLLATLSTLAPNRPRPLKPPMLP
jgi:hypothetical protein